LTLPKEMSIPASDTITSVRVVAPDLPLFIPINGGDIGPKLTAIDDKVYAALEMSHTTTVADVASSTSVEDRNKLFYHEATACISRSPLEYLSCFRDVPTYVANGFDLAIDDCINKGVSDNVKDYGQCDRFNETQNSDWWERHRQSFAARQVYAYERGLGWCFATWKLYGEDNQEYGVIDQPAKLLSLKDVVAAGLFPSLMTDKESQRMIDHACLNPPDNDYILGDDTLSPTMAPPPDCGNGWWNYSGHKCDYWIPPPPTPQPTMAPTAGCPACNATSICEQVAPPVVSHKSIIQAALGGALVSFIFVAIGFRYCLGGRRQEYSRIPN